MEINYFFVNTSKSYRFDA